MDDNADDNVSKVVVPYTRSFPLEDISIRSGGDGRTVEAYAAVFNHPAHIVDQDGEYEEVIDPKAFNRAIGLAKRPDGGWNIPVMYNHGMTMYGTPSDRHSVPIGVPIEIEADSRGLRTVTRYHDTPAANDVLEAIRERSIGAYSFQGAFRRSTPARAGKFRAGRDGTLQTVRRMESTLREFGPTPFPAYAAAEIVGVRAEQIAAQVAAMSDDERHRLAEMFRSGTPLADQLDGSEGTPDDSGTADQDQPEGHSARSTKTVQHRIRVARITRGLE